jgi:hypothetical protein
MDAAEPHAQMQALFTVLSHIFVYRRFGVSYPCVEGHKAAEESNYLGTGKPWPTSSDLCPLRSMYISSMPTNVC